MHKDSQTIVKWDKQQHTSCWHCLHRYKPFKQVRMENGEMYKLHSPYFYMDSLVLTPCKRITEDFASTPSANNTPASMQTDAPRQTTNAGNDSRYVDSPQYPMQEEAAQSADDQYADADVEHSFSWPLAAMQAVTQEIIDDDEKENEPCTKRIKGKTPQYNALVTTHRTYHQGTDTNKRWLINSGSTIHVTNDASGMVDCHHSNQTIIVGNGNEVRANYEGTVNLHVGLDTLIFHHVLFAKDFMKNVISISHLVYHKNTVTTTQKGLKVKNV